MRRHRATEVTLAGQLDAPFAIGSCLKEIDLPLLKRRYDDQEENPINPKVQCQQADFTKRETK